MTTPTSHDGATPIEEPVPQEHEGLQDAATVDDAAAEAEVDAGPAQPETAPVTDADPLARPGSAPADPPVEPSVGRTATLPVPPPPPAAATAPGQHAAPRPYPPVAPVTSRGMPTDATGLLPDPPPASAPASAADPRATAPVAAAPLAAAAASPSAPSVPAAPVADRPLLPDLPRRPGAKRHWLGILVGLLLTPLGLVLSAMGVGHMVDLPAGDGALTDLFGLVQLGAGALVLGVVALLGRWSPAVPLTGGVLWGLGGGGLALWDPLGVSEAVHGVTDGRFAQVAIDHILYPAQTGSLLVLGLVLLGAGIATGAARRAGRNFGARTVRAEQARAEAQRVDEERRAAPQP
ncbi:hypothetical protein [Actinotalea sp.]|uniref:hypothetical protein n=1 Tax=Actinotalea sp. TaxID=1872145 RepID=UPI003566191B